MPSIDSRALSPEPLRVVLDHDEAELTKITSQIIGVDSQRLLSLLLEDELDRLVRMQAKYQNHAERNAFYSRAHPETPYIDAAVPDLLSNYQEADLETLEPDRLRIWAKHMLSLRHHSLRPMVLTLLGVGRVSMVFFMDSEDTTGHTLAWLQHEAEGSDLKRLELEDPRLLNTSMQAIGEFARGDEHRLMKIGPEGPEYVRYSKLT